MHAFRVSVHASPCWGLCPKKLPVKLVIIGDFDSTGKAMLHDMRGTYIRRESPGFDDVTPSLRVIAFIAASVVVYAALLYLRFKWGADIGMDEASALYAP